jgi:DNA polymerase-3 subunit chi
MAEVLFYHLTETRLEDTLPQLLEKTLERGWRACVHCGDEDKMTTLDQKLWTFRDDSFLAHGLAEAAFSDQQPILLTTNETAQNNAEVRFVVEMGPEPDSENCERIVYMFDGHDQVQLEQARAQWKQLSSAGVEKTYWQQTPERRWVKKT